MSHEELYMKRCLQLAQKAKGHTAPNPMVGALLVYNGRVIGEGWHKQYGQPHAEVNCLDSVKEHDKHLIPESTMYVSLEPCAHYGKTPPCAARLVQERVKKVVIANADPFEKVKGAGINILRDGGVEVETGLLEKKGLWVNRRFFCFHQQKRPYIILKWAQTPEGFFAPVNKKPFRISNNHSQTLVHKWRTEEAAVLVGYNTALHDDPQLTARAWQGKQPLRLVIDQQLQLPGSHKLFNDEAATWVFNAAKQASEHHITYQQVTFDETLLLQMMHKLHEADILSVIVEGGAVLLNQFILQGLWDEARLVKGAISLSNGIPAPLLTNASLAFEAALQDDTLSVFINDKTAYPYPYNMEL